MDKKEVRKAKDNLALHVLLVQREVPSKATATAIAYQEGQDGLNRRLGLQGQLPAPAAAPGKAA